MIIFDAEVWFMRRIALCLMVLLSLFIGCASTTDKHVSNSYTADEQNSCEKNVDTVDVSLSKEQKEYLNKKMLISDSVLSQLNDIQIQYYLLRSGLELYNKSSGIEVNGIEYNISDKSGEYYYNKHKSSSKRINMSQAQSIRLKGNDIRIDDYMFYEYSIDKRSKKGDINNYSLDLKVEGYPNTTITILYSEESGKIKMLAPFLHYVGSSEPQDEGYSFSLLYDDSSINAFFEGGKNPGFKGKVYGEIPYGCYSEKALGLVIYNYDCKSYKYDCSYKLYKVASNKKELVAEYSGNNKDEVTISNESYEIIKLPLDESKVSLGNGVYILDFGKKEPGFVSGEVQFKYYNE